MYNDIYEVERDQYAGLIGEMKTDCFDMEKEYNDEYTSVRLVSKATNTLITERLIYEDGTEKYYIYNLPQNEERLAPKKIRKYELQTKEEVQAFFEVLNKLQKR